MTTGPESTTDDLVVTVHDGVLRLTMNRPASLNAMTDAMSDALSAALEGAVARDDVRVVLITGTGRAFCSGADIGGEEAHEQLDHRALDRANRLVRAVVACDKPVVAAVSGVAAGVGCSLALACDLAVAGESASFLLAFARIGLMPDGGSSATVAASIGRARAMRMALLAEPLTGREAHGAGLVSHCVADDDLAGAVEGVVRRLAGGPAPGPGGHQARRQRRDARPARPRPRARAHRTERPAAHRRRCRGDAGVLPAAAARLPRRVAPAPARPAGVPPAVCWPLAPCR